MSSTGPIRSKSACRTAANSAPTDWRGDRKTDLAIIRIESDKPLPFLQFGDSDSMEVGDRVLAIGAPFGLTGSVTHGIISAKSRNVRLNQYEDFLQTDAAINPGNSGGPLISLDGKVIGINSAIKSKSGGFQGVGLAISSNLAKTVVQQLLKEGSVKRGYLGVKIRDIDAELAAKLGVKEAGGVQITRVFDQSPAAKCGAEAERYRHHHRRQAGARRHRTAKGRRRIAIESTP